MPYVEVITPRVSVAGNEYLDVAVKWIDYHEIVAAPTSTVPEARFHSLRTCMDPNCELCLEEWLSEYDYNQAVQDSEPRILPADWDEIPF